MKILITRLREGSISGCLNQILKQQDYHEIRWMGNYWNIADLSTYPNDLHEFDVVFNCSGITLNQSVLDLDKIDIMKVFKVNVVGAAMLTSAYANARKNLGLNGLIVHVGSTGSRKVFTNCSAYCSSKAALAHYIQCAGYELKKDNISVVGVHPGNIRRTQMTNQVIRDLVSIRDMSLQQIEEIYKDAHNVEDVANFMISIMEMSWKDITGENFYMGQGWKG